MNTAAALIADIPAGFRSAPVMAAIEKNLSPRFKSTSCSQCGCDTGPDDAGHSSCNTHNGTSKAPNPFESLFEFEYVTQSKLSIRCYLEHDDYDESILWLVHAFVGVIDIHTKDGEVAVLSDEIVDRIEVAAMKAMEAQAKRNDDEAAIERYLDREAA